MRVSSDPEDKIVQNKSKIEKEREKLIPRANIVIERSRNLSASQYRILLFILSKLPRYDQADAYREEGVVKEKARITFTISIREYCEVVGLDTNSASSYSNIKSTVKKFADCSFYLPDETNPSAQNLVRWIEEPKINFGKGTISVYINKHLEPYLMNLKSHFKSINLLDVARFNGKYSYRLYDALTVVYYHPEEADYMQVTYDVGELYEKLGVPSSYRVAIFNQRILRPATDDIRKYSDKYVSFEANTSGRGGKIVSYTFYISDKERDWKEKTRQENHKALNAVNHLDPYDDYANEHNNPKS